MNDESGCSNCGQRIRHRGRVLWIFYPALLGLFLFWPPAWPPRLKFCEPCAATINTIGYLATMVVAVFLLISALKRVPG